MQQLRNIVKIAYQVSQIDKFVKKRRCETPKVLQLLKYVKFIVLRVCKNFKYAGDIGQTIPLLCSAICLCFNDLSAVNQFFHIRFVMYWKIWKVCCS